jgi:hypothetical protein
MSSDEKVSYTRQRKAALAGVADVGLLRKDATIWKQAVVKAGADKNINVFGKEKLMEAIRTFPFEEIRTTYVLCSKR